MTKQFVLASALAFALLSPAYTTDPIAFSEMKPFVFVASKNAKRYHLPTCKWVRKIKPENLISFTSESEAKRAGFSPCKVCHPLQTI
ncbi:MAG: hypothetical protein HY447_02275 [Candidatus Omnitrophica bacterium]|nr:hypothetical protein [Candidatus Omnitrophota bacterium]